MYKFVINKCVRKRQSDFLFKKNSPRRMLKIVSRKPYIAKKKNLIQKKSRSRTSRENPNTSWK